MKERKWHTNLVCLAIHITFLFQYFFPPFSHISKFSHNIGFAKWWKTRVMVVTTLTMMVVVVVVTVIVRTVVKGETRI
jgi:hypothetical protein